MQARIYHNPRCSKSRETLSLLQQHGAEVEIIPYLENPPSRATLEALRNKLGLPSIALVRTNEPEWKPFEGLPLGDEQLLDLLAANPRLLQRPIVEVGESARIGRPPERVLEILE